MVDVKKVTFTIMGFVIAILVIGWDLLPVADVARFRGLSLFSHLQSHGCVLAHTQSSQMVDQEWIFAKFDYIYNGCEVMTAPLKMSNVVIIHQTV